jgi:cytochrome c biogenesis protein
LIKRLASLKITYTLLLLLVLELIIFTALPAGKDGSRFASPLFLFPLLLFFINLGSCTILRLIRLKSWAHPSRAGADLIHLGLLLVILAGLLTPLLRQEAAFSLTEGGSLPFPGGFTFEVKKLDFSTYDDGRPESWRVQGEYGGSPVLIEVNHPMKARSLRLYLTNFSARPFLLIEENGISVTQDLAEGVKINERLWQVRKLIQDPEGWTLLFTNGDNEVSLRTGEFWEGVQLKDVRLANQAHFLLVKNPLRPLIGAGFILLASGLVLVPAAKGRRFWQG